METDEDADDRTDVKMALKTDAELTRLVEVCALRPVEDFVFEALATDVLREEGEEDAGTVVVVETEE